MMYYVWFVVFRAKNAGEKGGISDMGKGSGNFRQLHVVQRGENHMVWQVEGSRALGLCG